MRRRRLRCGAALALAVLLAAGVFVLWPRADRITRENFDRIRGGMSREEVYAILGPPGDYRTGPVKYQHIDLVGYDLVWTDDVIIRPDWEWIGDLALVVVEFDQEGCVKPNGW